MKIYNPVASGKASGRALGGVFSYNRGLGTFKKYTKSFNPNTPAMQEVKSRFSLLTKYWSKSLTYAQITLWNNWSLPWTDIYGATVLLTGINKFLICNDTLLRAGKPITDIPPTATPSELTVVNTTYTDALTIQIDGIPDAEVTAQGSFIRVEILGDLQSINYLTGSLDIEATGISVSRRPLKKNYKTVYFYDCRTGFDTVQELVISISKNGLPPSLQSVKIQRFNKWGFWSGLLEYTDAVTVFNYCKNGHFDSQGYWVPFGSVTIHDGKAYWTNWGNLPQAIEGLVVGKTYQIDLDHVWGATGGYNSVWFNGVSLGNMTATQHYQFTRTLSGSNRELLIKGVGTYSGNVDNVILTLI